jgi:hypothetical protein
MRNLWHAVDTQSPFRRARRPNAWVHAFALIAVLVSLNNGRPALRPAPAARVANINTHQTNLLPAPDDSSIPQHLVAIGDTLYFSADNGSSGRELWKSDGTLGNAVLVKYHAAVRPELVEGQAKSSCDAGDRVSPVM